VRNCFLLISIILTSYGHILAQNLTQSVRGLIIDETTKSPISGAVVQLDGTSKEGAISDPKGQFSLEVPTGRYRIQVSYLGYEPYLLPELLVGAGKEVVLTIEMIEGNQALQEVVIQAYDAQNTRDYISTRTITVEETQRFAASFYDPARLAASFPGVVTTSDQGNNIAVRGNSPNSLRWWLEGVEIVNPNHTSNAGTLTDKPTQNGGGVNMLSAQVLDNAQFITGGFTPMYSNVQSSLMDMEFRKGNAQRKEYVAQASLLGLELAAEGPFSEKSKSSYLVNYRYSTVGLLSAFGVDFGGESISFQDLSFNLTFPIKNGSLKFFGVGGLSRNTFTGARDSTEWIEDKSSQDIRFRSGMGTAGLRLSKSLGKASSLFATVAWSGVTSSREAEQIQSNGSTTPIQEYDADETKLSFHGGYRHKVGSNSELLVGTHLINHQFNILDSENDSLLVNDSAQLVRLAPYINFRFNLSPSFTLNLGTSSQYSTLNEEFVIEPRLSARWRIGQKLQVRASYARIGQMASSYALLSGGGQNKDLKFLKSDQVVLGLGSYLGNYGIKVEGYFQNITDVAIEDRVGSSYSVLNDLTTSRPVQMTSSGTGLNYGVDISIDRYFENDFYFIGGASVYTSEYEAADEISRSTRFDGGYTITLTGGKEFNHQVKNRTIGINGRIFYLGGLRDTPIDEDASRAAGTTVFIEDQAFSIQNSDYFRIDLRLSTTKNKPGYTRMIALDIQNVLGVENDAYLYFDRTQDTSTTVKQLGIIPVLVYRVEF